MLGDQHLASGRLGWKRALGSGSSHLDSNSSPAFTSLGSLSSSASVCSPVKWVNNRFYFQKQLRDLLRAYGTWKSAWHWLLIDSILLVSCYALGTVLGARVQL